MKKIETDLSKINTSLGRMTSLVDDALANTLIALKKRDASLAKEVADRDEQINAMELKIDHDCIVFIASNQPVASDLRRIASTHKIITDLERIGDITKDICRYVEGLKVYPFSKLDEQIMDMAEDVRKMLNDSIRSFTDNSLTEAKNVIKFDDVIDSKYADLKKLIISEMSKQENLDKVELYINQMLIVKYLEKIGDHAQNIAEWIVFNVSGEYKV